MDNYVIANYVLEVKYMDWNGNFIVEENRVMSENMMECEGRDYKGTVEARVRYAERCKNNVASYYLWSYEVKDFFISKQGISANAL